MLQVDYSKCITCGTCVEECPRGALEIIDDEVTHKAEKCMMCGHCLAVCPRGAIVIDGDGYDCMDVEEFPMLSVPISAVARKLIMSRRSVRRYTDDDVTDDELNLLLEAAKYSPTGMNVQGNALLVVKSNAEKDRLLEDTAAALLRVADAVEQENPGKARTYRAFGNAFINKKKDALYYYAPLVMFVFSNDETDGAICAATIGFMAQSLNLGFCYARIPAAAFKDAQMCADWQAPADKKCVLALLIGHPEPEYFCSVPRLTPPSVIF